MWVTFESNELIYPMRPSALARSGLGVMLYVLADHRVNDPVPASPSIGNYSSVTYADWIDPAELAPTSPLKALVERRQFLTKIEASLQNPAQAIRNDFTFTFAPSDTTYRTVKTRDIYLANFLCLGVLVFGVIIGAAWVLKPLTDRAARRLRRTPAAG